MENPQDLYFKVNTFFLNATVTALKPTKCPYISSKATKCSVSLAPTHELMFFAVFQCDLELGPNCLIGPNGLGEGQSPVPRSTCAHNSLSVKQDRCMDLLGIN